MPASPSSGRTIKLVLLGVIACALFVIVSTDLTAVSNTSSTQQQQRQDPVSDNSIGVRGDNLAPRHPKRSNRDGMVAGANTKETVAGGGLGAMEGALKVLAATAKHAVGDLTKKGSGEQQAHGDSSPEGNAKESPPPVTAAPSTDPKDRVAVTVLLTTSKKTVDLTSTVDAMVLLKFRIQEVMTLPPGLAWSTYVKDKAAHATTVRPTVTVSGTSTLSYSKRHEIHYVVLVTPEVPEKWQGLLKAGGWEVKVMSSPIEASEIRNKQIGREVVTDGAMGITEMVKVEGFKMKEYSRVVMVDADVFFHKNFEHLFTDEYDLQWTHGGWDIEWLNGGFLVFNPQSPRADQHYNRLLDLLREGDFRPGSGWKGAGVGWTYGGRTIQGLLPYYFLVELPELNKQRAVGGAGAAGDVNTTAVPEKENGSSPPALVSPDSSEGETIVAMLHKGGSKRAKGGVHQRMPPPDHLRVLERELDRCVYNNMVELEKCKKLNLDQLTSNHFTGACQKPWHCQARAHPLCQGLVNEWFQAATRFVSAKTDGRTNNFQPCRGGHYEQLPR